MKKRQILYYSECFKESSSDKFSIQSVLRKRIKIYAQSSYFVRCLRTVIIRLQKMNGWLLTLGLIAFIGKLHMTHFKVYQEQSVCGKPVL